MRGMLKGKSALLGIGLILVAATGAHAATPSKGALVLVPGTLNHLIPGSIQVLSTGEIEAYPYFSGNIVQTIESLGYAVYVVKNLSALGSMENNGEEVVAETREWYQSNFPSGNVPLTMLGHSAGGFYALYAASRLSDLPLQQLITISTPFAGADLANISASVFNMQSAANTIYSQTDGIIDLRGLPELTTPQVQNFLGALNLDPSLSIRSYGCYQTAMPLPFISMDARYLWPGFYGTAAAIGGKADGVVGLASVYGDGITLPTTLSSKRLSIQAVKDQTCNLDHAEQALDYRIFGLFGRTDIGYISSEQTRFYTAVLSQ